MLAIVETVYLNILLIPLLIIVIASDYSNPDHCDH
jgi:hypothetical protein